MRTHLSACCLQSCATLHHVVHDAFFVPRDGSPTRDAKPLIDNREKRKQLAQLQAASSSRMTEAPTLRNVVLEPKSNFTHFPCPHTILKFKLRSCLCSSLNPRYFLSSRAAPNIILLLLGNRAPRYPVNGLRQYNNKTSDGSADSQ